jgi:hypothetical protein
MKNLLNAISEAQWLTRERVLLYGAAIALSVIGMSSLEIAQHTIPGLHILGGGFGKEFAKDFWQFWSSANLAAAGEPEAAYVQLRDQPIDQVFPYPPIVMLLCRPLASLGYWPAVAVWFVPGLLLFIFMASRFIGWKMAMIASVATPAAFLNLHLQQNGYYTALLLGGGLILVDRRPVMAGLLLGFISYKPQFAILLAPALIAGAYWRVLGIAALTAAMLIVVSAVLYGPEIWLAFLHRSELQTQWMESTPRIWRWMATVFATMRLAGASSHAAYVGQAISTISAVVMIAVLWRQRGCPLSIKASGLLIAAFLATPYAWVYDAVILTLAAVWLACDGVETAFRSWEKAAVLTLLLFPGLVIYMAMVFRIQLAPILLWLCFAVIIRRGLAIDSRNYPRFGIRRGAQMGCNDPPVEV